MSVWTTEFLRLNLYSCKLSGYSCKLSCNSCRLTCLVIVQAKRARPRTPTPGSYRGTKPLMDRDGPPRGRQVFAQLGCVHLLQLLTHFFDHRGVLIYLLPAHVSKFDRLIGKRRSCLTAFRCTHNLSAYTGLLHQMLGTLSHLTTLNTCCSYDSRHNASRSCCLTCGHTCTQGSILLKRYIQRTS